MSAGGKQKLFLLEKNQQFLLMSQGEETYLVQTGSYPPLYGIGPFWKENRNHMTWERAYGTGHLLNGRGGLFSRLWGQEELGQHN